MELSTKILIAVGVVGVGVLIVRRSPAPRLRPPGGVVLTPEPCDWCQLPLTQGSGGIVRNVPNPDDPGDLLTFHVQNTKGVHCARKWERSMGVSIEELRLQAANEAAS